MTGFRIAVWCWAILAIAESRAAIGEDSTTFHANGVRFVSGIWVNTDSNGKKHEHAYSWALGRQFLILEDRTKDKPILSVIGIDPTTGKRTWWSFASDGEVSVERIVEKVTGKDASEGTFESDNGKSAGSFKENFSGPDRIEVIIDGKVDGVPVSGLQVWERKTELIPEFKLASAAPATIPPSMKVITPRSSFSSTTGQLPTGEKYVGVAASQWILGGKFLRLTESFVMENHELASYMFILGVDSKSGLATGWEFDSDGAVGKFVMAADGKSLKGRVQLSASEAMDYQGTLHYDSTDALVYDATGKIGDGPAKAYRLTSRKLESP